MESVNISIKEIFLEIELRLYISCFWHVQRKPVGEPTYPSLISVELRSA